MKGSTRGRVLLCLCVLASAGPALAQQGSAASARPGAPMQSSEIHAASAVRGTVTDVSGGVVPGAAIVLVEMQSGATSNAVSDSSGFFSFAGVSQGTYRITITARGFATWVQSDIPVEAGVDQDLSHIVLPVATATTDVQVLYTQHELAEQQLQIEEKQRVLAIIPNFYSSYNWHAPPLSVGQKMRLAFKSGTDPVAFLGAGFAAGVEQGQDSFPGYGQGAAGYGKRYGAAYADGLIGSVVGGGLLPSLFHQDPRFFYKADGTVRQRALYAIATAVIRRGDNGKWQPDYSGILGNIASGGISNLYYPASDRGAGLVFENAAIGTAFGTIGALMLEFVVPWLTTGGPHKAHP